MSSDRHRSVSERNQQRRQMVSLLARVSALAVLLGLVFYLGQRAAYSGMGIEPDTYRELQTQLPAARAQLAGLQDELDMERTRHSVSRQALEMVRRDLAAQQGRISQLEEELGFYKGLMSPGEIANGLSLRPIELLAREEQGRYAYRIVAQQEARKHDLLKGELYAEVFGMLNGERVNYPLAQLSDDLEGDIVTLRFRYFQSIEGEMTLPESFEPRGVSIVASSSSPKKTEVREQYAWQLQEGFNHVGK